MLITGSHQTPDLSVIIVTYNPRRDLLAWALDSLEAQTIAKDRFEVVVVDNNSSPPLKLHELTASRTLQLSLVREPRQGIMFARQAGIAATHRDLLVFVDDDNHLDPDYLEQALRLAREQPEIGAFGGITRGVFEAPLAKWQQKLLPSVGVRDYGPAPISSREPSWGPWEPIGAGMIVRRDVATAFAQFLEENPSAGALGRSGVALASGDDALMARLAYRLGYACSYQPALRLSHNIKQERLTFGKLCRTIEGHGHSEVLLYRALGNQDTRSGLPRTLPLLAANLLVKLVTKGLRAGYLHWQWDLGYWREWRQTYAGTSR